MATENDSLYDATLQNVASPWGHDSGDSPEVLHLVWAWSYSEPYRLGEAAPLQNDARFGRGNGHGERRLEFVRQRPGNNEPAGAVRDRRISREQLHFSQVSALSAHVVNAGRCPLLHNGCPVTEATLSPGDTLALENAAVFLVDVRPRTFRACRDYGQAFPFGEADPEGWVGESAVAWRHREQLASAAQSQGHVLILGESGVGKEQAARKIHVLSERAGRGLISRSAATIPEGLASAELFGNAKNYPNAGMVERKGLIGEAHLSTLFLDEIGELQEEQQAGLLRVLDATGEYQRLGESQVRRSDFRLVAATNRPPESLKADFLARFPQRIHISPLRERRSDLPFVVKYMLSRLVLESPKLRQRFAEQRGDSWFPRLHPLFLDLLLRQEFRLNVREVEQLLQKSISTSSTDYLGAPEELGAPSPQAQKPSREAILKALVACDNSATAAARQLGLASRYVLYRLMKKYDIDRGADPRDSDGEAK